MNASWALRPGSQSGCTARHRGTNVVLISGAVRWLDAAEFQELLERTQAAREAVENDGAGF